MEIFIIRHGQSGNNALEDVSLRTHDPLLTETGEKQAEIVGPFLAAGGHLTLAERQNGRAFLDHLYCSPMIRTLQTAQPIGQALGLAPEVWVDIHEQGGLFLDHGEEGGIESFPGQTRSQILQQFPNYILPDEIGEDGWWNRGFEGPHLCHGRAINVADTLLRRGGEKSRIGLVVHGGFMDSILKALGHQLPGDGRHYHHDNTPSPASTWGPKVW
jgi:2,3-bisphosphoglycerate-dependent phosphoglycerate mutase